MGGGIVDTRITKLTRRVFETKLNFWGTNKRGRPRKPWEDYIKEEVGIDWLRIKYIVRDRASWSIKSIAKVTTRVLSFRPNDDAWEVNRNIK